MHVNGDDTANGYRSGKRCRNSAHWQNKVSWRSEHVTKIEKVSKEVKRRMEVDFRLLEKSTHVERRRYDLPFNNFLVTGKFFKKYYCVVRSVGLIYEASKKWKVRATTRKIQKFFPQGWKNQPTHAHCQNLGLFLAMWAHQRGERRRKKLRRFDFSKTFTLSLLDCFHQQPIAPSGKKLGTN